MSKRIRSLIWVNLLLAFCIVVVLGVVQFIGLPSAVGTLFHRGECATQPGQVAQGERVEQLLAAGQTDEAMDLVKKGMREATDSLEYYKYVVLEAKCHFVAMDATRFYASYERLHRFLDGHPQGSDMELRALRAEEMMQRGVYEVKMVGRMDSALFYYQQALALIRKLPCSHDDQLLALTNIADAYKWMGSYDKSVSFYLQAMELGDSVGMSDAAQTTIDIGIASAYAAMGNFEQSGKWWLQAEQMRPNMQRGELFQYLNNRGNDFYLQGKYRESLDCYLQLDSLVNSYPDMQWEKMYGQANLSDVYIKLGQQQRALPLLDETEAFFQKEQQQIPLYYLSTQRIELALLSGNTAEAERLAGEDTLTDRMIPEQKLLRLKILMRLYHQLGQWQRYAETQKSVDQLQDSIMSDKIKMQFSEVLMRHEHERQLLLKQRQLEEMNLSFRWAIALLVAAALAIVLLIIIIVQKRRERRMKEQAVRGQIASLRMESVRNRITPHFMGNALAAEMLAQMDGKEVDLDSLVQLLHRGIEMTGTEQTTLSEELEFITFYCDVESRSIGPDFVLRTELAPDVHPDQVVLPAMFVQILVENALKHGLKAKPRQEGKERMVLVRASRRNAGTLVEVIDNGVGLNTERRNPEHTGLKVVRQTMQLLNEQNRQQMEFTLDNYLHPNGETGCCATIYLPDDYRYVIG